MRLSTNQRRAALPVACLFILFMVSCIGSIVRHHPTGEVVITLPDAPEESFRGRVVVIDPGHGGMDPGSHGVVRGENVYEAPYVNDVALRVARYVRAHGGLPILTRENPRIRESDHNGLFSLARDDRFHDGTVVRAGSAGMEERLAVVRRALAQHSQRNVVFVSIHFDAEPNVLQGAFVIAPAGTLPRIAASLVEEFRSCGRTRRRREGSVWLPYTPLLVNGRARNLYILRGDKNPARERVLVELGNFSDPGDLWRIRSPSVREQYAIAIAHAILN